MPVTVRRLFAVGLLGAAGGAVNGWLCWAKIPTAVSDTDLVLDFRWLVIPGGAIHGALLAALSVGAAVALARRSLRLRLAAAPVVGWAVGYLSWIPLARWAAGASWGESLLWTSGRGVEHLWVPLAHFGLVAGLLYLFLAAGVRRPALAFGAAVAAGVLGSLWWWIVWERWTFALIHGVAWGALVGAGLAVARARPERALEPR